MLEDLKAKWLEALRSGEYKQGRDKLRNAVTNQFCCLGVLCEIDPDVQRDNSVGTFTYYRFSDDRSDSVGLPTSYQDRVQLDARLTAGVISMNDSGVSFERIADHLEQFA